MLLPDPSSGKRSTAGRPLDYARDLRRPASLLGATSVLLALLPCVILGIGAVTRPDPFVLGLFLPGILAGLIFILLIGVATGLAGFRAGGTRNRQLAALGLGLNALWPTLLLIGFVAANARDRHRNGQYVADHVRSGERLAANLVADSKRTGRFPGTADAERSGHVYLGRGLTRSASFESVAGQIILSCSFDLPGTRGRVFTFADGTCRCVSPEELETVLGADDEARIRLGHDRVGDYLRTYMGVRK